MIFSVRDNKILRYVWIIAVTFHVTLAVTTENLTYSGNAEADLITEILAKLKTSSAKYGRPVAKATDTLDVSFHISPIHILDFDEKNQLLTTMMWLNMEWKTHDLEWDPVQYDAVEQIVLPPDLFWTPDVMLYNRVDAKPTESLNRLVLYYNGTILWIPCVVYVSVCPVNMENFPYDVQTCPFEFGSWSFDETKLNLSTNSATGGIDRSEYRESMEWELQGVQVIRHALKYNCCVQRFIIIEYEFVLARNSSFYTQFLILPVVLLGTVVLAIFWIPPSRPDRTGLGMSLFASFMLLLLLVVQISPPSKTIKLITYCAINIILTASATILSALVVNVSGYDKPAPWLVLKFLGKNSPTRTGNKARKTKEDDDSVNLKVDNTESHYRPVKPGQNHKNWVQFSLLLDRAFFFVYLIIIITTLALYLPMPL